MTKPRPSSSVRADRELAEFISSLKKGSYSDKIIRKAIETLRQNMFAGEKIERRKFPKYYIDKYGINNLFKMDLDSRSRLTYTLVAEESGVAIVILEVFFSHKEYERRFGYG